MARILTEAAIRVTRDLEGENDSALKAGLGEIPESIQFGRLKEEASLFMRVGEVLAMNWLTGSGRYAARRTGTTTGAATGASPRFPSSTNLLPWTPTSTTDRPIEGR